MTDPEAHRHPCLAVNLVIVTILDRHLCAVVMPRDDLGKGAFALPVGFVHHGHSLDPTVQRVLVEKTGLTGIALEQLATYGDPARDPRGHVVSVVYLALLPATQLAQASLAAGLQLADILVNRTGETDASAWARAKGAVLPLAFDHAAILGDMIKRLRGKIDYSLIGFAFLPPRFTLRAVHLGLQLGALVPSAERADGALPRRAAHRHPHHRTAAAPGSGPPRRAGHQARMAPCLAYGLGAVAPLTRHQVTPPVPRGLAPCPPGRASSTTVTRLLRRPLCSVPGRGPIRHGQEPGCPPPHAPTARCALSFAPLALRLRLCGSARATCRR